MRRTALTASAALMLLTVCVLAQAAPGRIEVHVSPSGPAVAVLMAGGQIKAVGAVAESQRGCLLENIAAGKYTLVVSASARVSVIRTVTVPDGGETEVGVELPKLTGDDYKTRGRIVGFVKGANGKPIANATLVLVKDRSPVGAARPGNATGVYELEWYPPGSYKVIVEAPGYKSKAYARQQITAGAAKRLDVTLQAK